MRYQIETAPIWDAYRDADGCPFCAILADKEKRVVKSYLNENVMDPDCRVRSNAVGFCPEHIRMMYAGENKLGFALQLETRAAYLKDLVAKPPTDKRSAKKTADELHKHIGCVICAELEAFMPRYFETAALMYANEPEFPDLFLNAKHCVKHAEALYAAAENAGKKIKEFLAALSYGLRRELKRTESELRGFADCFDHGSKARPDPDAPPRAVTLLITPKLK